MGLPLRQALQPLRMILLGPRQWGGTVPPCSRRGLEGLPGPTPSVGPVSWRPLGASKPPSSHFHLMVTDTALMSEGDNTWELKITIAST